MKSKVRKITGKTFSECVYLVTSLIPKGRVTTYGDVARVINNISEYKIAYRAVGNALNKNPNAPIVPCHRVISSDMTLGGYAFGLKAKIKILAEEGIDLEEGQFIPSHVLIKDEQLLEFYSKSR